MPDKQLAAPSRHRWVCRLLRNEWRTKFETDPYFQYKIHMWFTYFWLVNMVFALSVFIFFQGFWAKASILYVVLVSLYANFSTDYGAVSAAEGANKESAELAAKLADQQSAEIAALIRENTGITRSVLEHLDAELARNLEAIQSEVKHEGA